MATLATQHLTMLDMMKQTVGDSIETDIAEIMSETSDLLSDLHVSECNMGTFNKSVVRHGLPKSTFRKLYGYVPTSKSTVEQVVDTTGDLESYSTPDIDLIDRSKNPAQARLNEGKAFIEGMAQDAQEAIIYGSRVDNDAEFDGLAVRYAQLSNEKKNIGYNVIDAGGTGSDNTSIWFITTGENDVKLLYPEGSKAGIQHYNDGVQTETNSKGEKRKVYQDHYKLSLGVAVKDWRSTCRIANISVSKLEAGEVDLLKLLRKGYYRVKKHIKKSGQKTFIYCTTSIAEALDEAATNKPNVNLNIKEYCGADIAHYKGIPIREIDQMLETEERVVAAASA